mmetsp:Transcript_71367/g.167193  ORF Transcript_71367/g.167193 Transcript_71367/m.167193 type:complete len:239 (-) Transcript_71367:121-837(-)
MAQARVLRSLASLQKAMSYGDRASTLKSSDGRTEAELLASTVRSLADADDTSTRVLTTLHEQTEQLHRIKADADAINHNLDQSEWLLRNMKPLGWIRNIFRKEPKTPGPMPSSSTRRASSSSNSSAAAAAAAGYPAADVNRGAARLLAEDAARRAARNSTSSASSAPAVGAALDKRSQEVDKAYDQIDNMLEGLLAKSQQIQHTLSHHNEVIPEIAETVERDQLRIKKQQLEIKKRMG